jgi:hypothetical protein
MLPADPLIRRRWLAGFGLLVAAWFLLLWPLANALFGPPGQAPDNDAQANRLVYEEVVKLALVLGPIGLASWLGIRTLASRAFPPTHMRVPVPLSITLGPAALAAGVALLLGAVLTLAFRLVSLRVSLELAALIRRIG